MKILGFLLAPLQAWWYARGVATAAPVSPKPPARTPNLDQLSILLDKYKELPKQERHCADVPKEYQYIQSVAKQQDLLRRMHKLLGRYGFDLTSIEYNVAHNAQEEYFEELTLNITRHRQFKP